MKSIQSLVRLAILDSNLSVTLLVALYYDILECQSRGFSYVVPLKITFQLRHYDPKDGQGAEEILQSEVDMGEIPLMTEQRTFIINGSERVIVNQLHRSPSATFGEEAHSSGHKLLKAKIIPDRGAWIEFEFDIKDLIYVRLDRKKRCSLLCC